MSEILAVLKIRATEAHWLILDCQHWYKWTGPKAPRRGTELECPVCKALPVVVGQS